MARIPLNLRSDSRFANFRLALSALGVSQSEERTSNFWNGCHFAIVNFVSVMVTMPVRRRDLIVK